MCHYLVGDGHEGILVDNRIAAAPSPQPHFDPTSSTPLLRPPPDLEVGPDRLVIAGDRAGFDSYGSDVEATNIEVIECEVPSEPSKALHRAGDDSFEPDGLERAISSGKC